MVSCHDLRSRAGALVDGELPAAEALAFDAHAVSCRDCSAIIAEQRVTRALVGTRNPGTSRCRPGGPAGCRRALATPPAGRLSFPMRARHPAAGHDDRVAVVGGRRPRAGRRRRVRGRRPWSKVACAAAVGARAQEPPDRPWPATGVSARSIEAAWKASSGMSLWSHLGALARPLAAGNQAVSHRRGRDGPHPLRGGGRRVSLFIVPSTVDGAAADLSIMGVETTSWAHGAGPTRWSGPEPPRPSKWPTTCVRTRTERRAPGAMMKSKWILVTAACLGLGLASVPFWPSATSGMQGLSAQARGRPRPGRRGCATAAARPPRRSRSRT